MKIISIACLLGLIGLLGCTTMDSKMASWVGHPEAELLSQFGAPDSSTSLPNGTKVDTWVKIWYDANGRLQQGRQTFTVNANGYVAAYSYENMPIIQWRGDEPNTIAKPSTAPSQPLKPAVGNARYAIDELLDNGARYTGLWELHQDNKWYPTGEGTETWLDGKKYVGEFRDGKRNGQGTETSPSGAIQAGLWQDDKLVGETQAPAIDQAPPNGLKTMANPSTAPSQPSAFDQALQSGATAYQNKDFKAASVSFLQAVTLNPASQQAWTALGLSYGFQRDFPSALYAFRRAVDIDTNQAGPLAGLAGVYAEIGETNKYTETLEKVRRIDPALADATIEFLKEDNAKANAAASGTYSASPLANSATTTDPIATYSQVVKLKPDNEEAWAALGWADDKAGHNDDAIAAYRQAIKLNSFYSGAWNGLGMCYGKAGRTNEAVDAFHQAIKLRPDYAEAWYNLGATYGRAGLTNEANDAFQQARKLNPGLFK